MKGKKMPTIKMTTLRRQLKGSRKGRRGPAMSDPWIEGYDARLAQRARSANPYRGADSRGLWDDGWVEAAQECARQRKYRLEQAS
jgi:ribosome modulation factor